MEDEDYYCEEHNLKSPAYEDGPDPHCPYCRRERLIDEDSDILDALNT